MNERTICFMSAEPLQPGMKQKRENRLALMRCVQTDCRLMDHSVGHFTGLNRVYEGDYEKRSVLCGCLIPLT